MRKTFQTAFVMKSISSAAAGTDTERIAADFGNCDGIGTNDAIGGRAH